MPSSPLSRRRFLGVAASAAALGVTRDAWPALGEAQSRQRSHFVLIHGAWHGAWCWYKIQPALEAAGHRVTVLELPAGGIDPTPAAGVTRQDQVDRVVAVLDEVREPVVLVGHSAGGLVISAVADARPEKIDRLVYLTAFLLPNGVSPVTQTVLDSESLVAPHLVFHSDGTIEIAPAGRREVFYGDCSARDVALAQSLLRPVPLRLTTDPVVAGPGFERVRRFYITCLNDHAIGPAFQERMYTALPCELVLPLHSDHSPFLSHPAALVHALTAIARA